KIAMYFFFQAEDGIRDFHVTGVQTCALPISGHRERAMRTTATGERSASMARTTVQAAVEASRPKDAALSGLIRRATRSPGASRKIGRASCRERVSKEAVAVALKTNKKRGSEQ